MIVDGYSKKTWKAWKTGILLSSLFEIELDIRISIGLGISH